MKYLLILFVLNMPVFNHTDSGKGEFTYEVEVKNGGSDGFNHVECTCNTLTGVYKNLYSEPGYEKFKHCCKDDMPKGAVALIDRCDDLVMQGRDTSGMIESGGFQAKFDIQDKDNFKYTVKRAK